MRTRTAGVCQRGPGGREPQTGLSTGGGSRLDKAESRHVHARRSVGRISRRQKVPTGMTCEMPLERAHWGGEGLRGVRGVLIGMPPCDRDPEKDRKPGRWRFMRRFRGWCHRPAVVGCALGLGAVSRCRALRALRLRSHRARPPSCMVLRCRAPSRSPSTASPRGSSRGFRRRPGRNATP